MVLLLREENPSMLCTEVTAVQLSLTKVREHRKGRVCGMLSPGMDGAGAAEQGWVWAMALVSPVPHKLTKTNKQKK